MNSITKYIRVSLLAGAFVLAGATFSSCNDDIEMGKLDDSDYEKVDDIYYSLRNANGPRGGKIEIRKEAISSTLHVSLSKAANRVIDITLKVDETLLAAYNEQNKTTYPMFPVDLVSLEEDGAVVIAPGDRDSGPMTVTLNVGDELVQGTTYVLPIATQLQSEGVKLSQGAGEYLFFVKVLGEIPSTDKGTGIITIAYVECNSNNPLNAGEWRLAKSGKPLFDIVNLFAANINYIEATGRIGVTINPNLQHIFDNKDQYIKPLQEMGMKVCLTILGNHDGTGVANLSDEAAREFAAELKAIVEAYDLDGVDFDDEWSDYNKYPLRPGCVKRGGDPFARLCYETKRAMPDKLCTVYYIGAVVPDPEQDSYGFNKMIDGMLPGDFVDYSYYAQYGAISEAYTTIKGMIRKQWGAASIDVGNSPNIWNLDFVRKNGYGVQVIYDVTAVGTDMQSPLYQNHKTTFDAIAKKLYDDTGVVWSGINH